MSPTNPDVPGHPPTGPQPFRLGEWLVNPGSGEITDGRSVLRIELKAMDVLVYLAAHPREVVSREDLERNVWHGALVGYDAVTNTVIKLRKALGDDPHAPTYIATIPKRGYQLIALVSPVKAELTTRQAEPSIPSITAGSVSRRPSSPSWGCRTNPASPTRSWDRSPMPTSRST